MTIKKLLFVLLLAPGIACAAQQVRLDRAQINERDVISVQRGARHFVNYCLNCHAASYMRYSRLTDLGLTEQQIKEYLILTGAKVGDTMTVAMTAQDARDWFGAAPPDLSVIARARGADWLYTYLRSFYRDDTRPTGWNNLVFDKVGMPHVLYQLQGEQVLQIKTSTDSEGRTHVAGHLVLDKPGSLTAPQYNAFVADLVNYLVYMAEPAKGTRIQIGIVVLFFLAFFFVLVLALKKEYWKDIK